jgi:hypothetical protein
MRGRSCRGAITIATLRILDEAVGTGRVTLVRGEAVAAEDGALLLADGSRLPFDALVLAGGNYPFPPAGDAARAAAVEDPWGPGGARRCRRWRGRRATCCCSAPASPWWNVALSLIRQGFAGR